jgi:hypothetical protein
MIAIIANLVISGWRINAAMTDVNFVKLDQLPQKMSTKSWATALYICRDRNFYINQKGNFIMKSIATLIATLFAATVFAAEPAKAPATPAAPAPAATASAPVPAAATPAKKEEKKAKPEVAKADATKSATPAPAAKDTKTEAVKK